MIALFSILFFLLPEQSNTVLAKVRFFLGDTFGVYYLAIGLGVFLLSLYLAFSKYGDIVLGEQDEKPKYSFFCLGIHDVYVRPCGRHFCFILLQNG